MSTPPLTLEPLLQDCPAIELVDLPQHGWATVTEVLADEQDLLRLMGLGICTGRRVQLLKSGDPMILRVYGTRIGLSARLARQVRVRTESAPSVA